MRNRRLFLRQEFAIKTVLEASDGTRHLAVITELGLGGARLRSSFVPSKRQSLLLQPVVGSDPAVPTQCRWLDEEGCFGLRFTCDLAELLDSWLLPHLASREWRNCDLLERREHLRIEADLPAQVEHAHATVQARILNLSAGGLLLESSSPLPEEEALKLKIEVDGRKLRVQGRLVRPGCRSGQAWRHSVRFDKPAPRLPRAVGGF